MKTTLFTTALAAILGLALAGAPTSVQAQTTTNTATAAAPATTPAAPTKTKKAKSDKTEYRGTLTVIDTTGNTITVASVKDPTKTLVLAIAPTTKIAKDRASKTPATLADFTIGQKVTGSYTKDSTGKLTAYSLYLKTDKTKTPKSTKTPAGATPAAPAAPAAPATPSTPAVQ